MDGLDHTKLNRRKGEVAGYANTRLSLIGGKPSPKSLWPLVEPTEKYLQKKSLSYFIEMLIRP